MRNWILFSTVLLWTTHLGGCATHPPAHIIDDRYINFEYGYSIEVPQGWEVQDEIPQDLRQYFGGLEKKKHSVMLINNGSKGLIMSLSRKKYKDFSSIIDINNEQIDELAGSVTEAIAKYPKVYNTKTESKNHNISITINRYRENSKSFKPEEILTGNYEFERHGNTMYMYFDLFVYPCHGGKMCIAQLFLISPNQKIEQNLPAFHELSDSLKGHDNSNR